MVEVAFLAVARDGLRRAFVSCLQKRAQFVRHRAGCDRSEDRGDVADRQVAAEAAEALGEHDARAEAGGGDRRAHSGGAAAGHEHVGFEPPSVCCLLENVHGLSISENQRGGKRGRTLRRRESLVQHDAPAMHVVDAEAKRVALGPALDDGGEEGVVRTPAQRA